MCVCVCTCAKVAMVYSITNCKLNKAPRTSYIHIIQKSIIIDGYCLERACESKVGSVKSPCLATPLRRLIITVSNEEQTVT